MTKGVVAFCHGFKITDEFFLYREIGLCSRDGYHHLLLSYSPGHDLSAFSNETQMSIDEQMKYDHGLTFDHSGRDQELVAADVEKMVQDPLYLRLPGGGFARGNATQRSASSHGHSHC